MLGGYSKIIVPFIVYIAMFIAIYYCFTKRKEYALFITLPLFCLPNIRIRLSNYPIGKDFIDIIFLCLIISLIFRNEIRFRIKNSPIILCYIITLMFSFFVIGDRLGGGIDIKNLADFKNYIMIAFCYFIFYWNINEKGTLRKLIVVLSIAFLAMDRSTYGEYGLGLHHNFVSEQRPGGVFGSEGLGANHLGAFMAEYTMVLIGIAYCCGKKFIMRGYNIIYILWLAIIGNLYSLVFSFSRGAWIGAIIGLVFIILTKAKKLIFVLIFFLLFWQQILPESVIQRVDMSATEKDYQTELDAASVHRLEIWEHALTLFKQNPIFGVGLYNFKFFDGEKMWTSTHNQYLAFLSETGIIGFIVFLTLNFIAFKSGWRLFRFSKDAFNQGLGIGFCGCVIACMLSNIFGDRWSYFSLQSIYFVIWAMVAKAYELEAEENN